jgi:hypothetical protein
MLFPLGWENLPEFDIILPAEDLFLGGGGGGFLEDVYC